MQTHRAISVPLAGLSRAANPVIIIRRQAYKQFVQQQREVDPHLIIYGRGWICNNAARFPGNVTLTR